MLRLITILFLSATLFSCNDEYTLCTESRTVQMNSFFYKKIGTQEITTNAPELNIVDLKNNTTILSNQQNLSTFSLVLNPTRDSMRFQVSLKPNLPKDTLTIVYTTTNRTLSPECGVISTHNITKAYTTKNTIESVRLTNTSVDVDLAANVRIYF